MSVDWAIIYKNIETSNQRSIRFSVLLLYKWAPDKCLWILHDVYLSVNSMCELIKKMALGESIFTLLPQCFLLPAFALFPRAGRDIKAAGLNSIVCMSTISFFSDAFARLLFLIWIAMSQARRDFIGLDRRTNVTLFSLTAAHFAELGCELPRTFVISVKHHTTLVTTPRFLIPRGSFSSREFFRLRGFVLFAYRDPSSAFPPACCVCFFPSF